MSEILSKITKILSGDLAFLLALFIIIFFCAMYFGKNRIIAVILAYYPAMLLYKSFTFIDKLIFLSGENLIIANKIIIFLIFFGLIYFVINKHLRSYDESSNAFRRALLSLGIIIIIVHFSYNVVNYDVFHNYSNVIDGVFNGGSREFIWNLVPIVILSLI